MKLIRDCDPQERMIRALIVLDAMALSMPDILDKNPESPVEHFVHNVYRIAHSSHGHCGNPHINWMDAVDKQAALLEEDGIMINLDKRVTEVKTQNVR